MRIHERILALTLLSGLAGCGTVGPLGPLDPAGVSMELAVSGGFAGVQYSFEIDGASLEVRGVTCTSFCDFDPGDLLLVISARQLADLAGRLEDADVFGSDGDYGNQCCDQFHYDLTYRRGGRSARVRGSTEALPPALRSAIAHLVPLSTSRVPLLLSPETTPEAWPRDAYQLGTVTVQGLELHAEVTYGGGCASHAMDLVAWGGWLESFPVQINALITHDDGADPCDALITSERAFGLAPLVAAYHAAYPGGGPATVILRLWDPEGTGSDRMIEIEF